MLYFNLNKVIFMSTILFGLSECQKVQNCQMQPSSQSGQVDIHCSCMEQLIEWKNPVYKMTVNQTGCRENVLRLDWTTLQSFIDVKVIVFDGASVIFKINKENTLMNCSVTEIIFYNSEFKVLPVDAFYGLAKMKILRILGGNIEEISSKAINGFHLLKTIEFANVSIGKIKANAFEDLPQVEDLAFVKCNIGTLESNAIKILVPPSLPTVKCPTIQTRSRTATDVFVAGLMGRSLESVHDIQLPEQGSRLFFFSCEIESFETGSIMTNVFPYIILAGNIIKSWKTLAIESRVLNECDIGAFLLIHNAFLKLEPKSFKGISGSHQEANNTVMAVIKNKFASVAANGFVINKDLNIPYIHSNTFECNCPNLRWASLSRLKSNVQSILETNLLDTSTCLGDETAVSTFIQQCPIYSEPETPNFPSSTLIPEPSFTDFHRGPSSGGGTFKTITNLVMGIQFTIAVVHYYGA